MCFAERRVSNPGPVAPESRTLPLDHPFSTPSSPNSSRVGIDVLPKEKDGLLVPPSKASTLLSVHLITG